MHNNSKLHNILCTILNICIFITLTLHKTPFIDSHSLQEERLLFPTEEIVGMASETAVSDEFLTN